MKKIREFFNKYKNIILIFCTILIVILFFTCIGFSKENFSVFIGMVVGGYLSYMGLFNLEKLEQFILNKITYILLSGIIFIIYSQKDLGINNKDILLMSGGIIAFWYGYKKYERDKELEIIEKYTKYYENIDINGEYNEEKISKLINLWYKEFFLVSKGYISDELWIEWCYWINLDIQYIINNDAECLNEGKEPIFIPTIKGFYGYNASNKIKVGKLTFIEYLFENIDIIDKRAQNTLKTRKDLNSEEKVQLETIKIYTSVMLDEGKDILLNKN